MEKKLIQGTAKVKESLPELLLTQRGKAPEGLAERLIDLLQDPSKEWLQLKEAKILLSHHYTEQTVQRYLTGRSLPVEVRIVNRRTEVRALDLCAFLYYITYVLHWRQIY